MLYLGITVFYHQENVFALICVKPVKLLHWQPCNFIIVVSQPPAQSMSFAKNVFKADGQEICEAFIIFVITCYKGREPVWSNIAAESLQLPDSHSHGNTNPA